MNLQQLRYIVEIADCHSITKASRRLFVSQPYLSKVVSDFEARLHKQIFIRYNNGLELTADGHKVYLLARSIIGQMDQLEHLGQEEQSEEDGARLSFSVGNLILKDSLLLDYLSTVQARVQAVDFDETTIEGCIKNMEEGRSEFAIVVVDDFQKTLLTGMASRRELACMELDQGYPYYHFHRNHPLANQNEIQMDSLIRYPLVRLKMDEYARFSSQQWRREYPDAYVRRYIVVNHYHSYLNIVKHDYAFMIGNKWQISELEKMDIQSVRFPSLKHKVHLMILKKELIPFSREAKQFLQLFKNSYGLDMV